MKRLGWIGRSLKSIPTFTAFFREMIAFRKRHKILGSSRFWRDRILWRGVGAEPDRSHNSHTLAFLLEETDHSSLYVIVNAYSQSLSVELPGGYQWRRAIDTSLPSPSDIAEGGEETALPQTEQVYLTAARSVVVLEGQRQALPKAAREVSFQEKSEVTRPAKWTKELKRSLRQITQLLGCLVSIPAPSQIALAINPVISEVPCNCKNAIARIGPPIAAKPTGWSRMQFKYALFPFDYSDRCRHAAPSVQDLIEKSGAHLTMLNVIEDPSAHYPASAVFLVPQSERDELLASSARFLQKYAHEAFPGYVVDPICRMGDPAKKIIRITSEIPIDLIMAALECKADLVVIGRGSLQGFLGRLRTNAYAIIRDSPCPVLSV